MDDEIKQQRICYIIMFCLFSLAFCLRRLSKENRAVGVLENFAEGKEFSEHFLRLYVHNKTPEIMPKICFFVDPNYDCPEP
ncbi:hypothetical protein CISIN_1g036394mg [Citrus sinensis]|uniref:Uncharacterized protein n=1 Tax=Citrus sinensis TaxID=2711 RepID=A0A067EGS8_CITSI|nr:hypothetical protein CISIN_1g036394mg [Citrus sinensis]